jgi:hypothetical protein
MDGENRGGIKGLESPVKIVPGLVPVGSFAVAVGGQSLRNMSLSRCRKDLQRLRSGCGFSREAPRLLLRRRSPGSVRQEVFHEETQIEAGNGVGFTCSGAGLDQVSPGKLDADDQAFIYFDTVLSIGSSTAADRSNSPSNGSPAETKLRKDRHRP